VSVLDAPQAKPNLPLFVFRAPVDPLATASGIGCLLGFALALSGPLLWTLAMFELVGLGVLLLGGVVGILCFGIVCQRLIRAPHRRFFLFEDHLMIEEHYKRRGFVTTRVPFGAIRNVRLAGDGRISFSCATEITSTSQPFVMKAGRLHAEDVLDLIRGHTIDERDAEKS
jgi:hypothetical protein